MSVPHPPEPTLLTIGVIATPDVSPEVWLAELRAAFGPEETLAGPLPFDQTTYYREEMGEALQRWFVAMAAPFDAGRLAETKRRTNEIEARLAVDGQRRVNLDPGCLSLSNLVLATGKGYAHRVYLGGGLYAEVTLLWQNGGWCDLPWTYPDYRSAPVKAILAEFRETYRQRLRQIRLHVDDTHPRRHTELGSASGAPSPGSEIPKQVRDDDR
jgi:hypothetical protein